MADQFLVKQLVTTSSNMTVNDKICTKAWKTTFGEKSMGGDARFRCQLDHTHHRCGPVNLHSHPCYPLTVLFGFLTTGLEHRKLSRFPFPSSASR